MNLKQEIRNCLQLTLEQMMDDWLASLGFVRRKNSLLYVRRCAEAVQKIDIALSIHPSEEPTSAAAIYPCLEVSVKPINSLISDMVDGDQVLFPTRSNITLRQPIEFTSAKAMHARWYVYQEDSAGRVVQDMQVFLERWTIPFLEDYATIQGFCGAYDRNDPRLMGGLVQRLTIVAALVLRGRIADATAAMERWFGKPGLRRQYSKVFAFLDSRRQRNELG